MNHNAYEVDTDPDWYMHDFWAESERNPDKRYQIKLFAITTPDRTSAVVAHFGCTCPHWINKKQDTKDRYCKHTKAVMRALEAQGKLAPWRGESKRIADRTPFNYWNWLKWSTTHVPPQMFKLKVIEVLDIPDLDIDLD
jgi:hypothetical protein